MRLRHLIRQEKENGILIRLLLKESERVEHHLSDREEPFLSWLFPEGLHNAFLIAGESFLEGGWYEEARQAFEEALRIRPGCEEAMNGLSILERRVKDMAFYGTDQLTSKQDLNGLNVSQIHKKMAGGLGFEPR